MNRKSECLDDSFIECFDRITARTPVERDPFTLTLSAECEPLTSVAGCVNVRSGHFFQIEKDLTSNTIDPLEMVRYYDSGSENESFLGYGFGSGFPLWASDGLEGARHDYVLISEREGFLLPYRNKTDGPTNICHIDPRILQKGYTNLSRSARNSQSPFTTWQALFRFAKNHSDGEWLLKMGDGRVRLFSKCVRLQDEQRSRMGFPTKKAYLLTKELKLNGNQIHYVYQTLNGKIVLKQIQTLNRTKQALLNALTFDYSPDWGKLHAGKDKRAATCTVSSLDGQSAQYHLEEALRPQATGLGVRPKMALFLKQVSSSQKGARAYDIQDPHWYVKKIVKPNGSCQKVHYSANGKVKSLAETLEGEDITRYAFDYHKSATDVFNALGQRTTYHFDDSDRLVSIRYLEDGASLREEAFAWSTREGEEGWLKSKAIKVDDRFFSLKTFRYDKNGHLTRETLYGNLTGQKKETFPSAKKEQMDHWFVDYTYFPDSRSLLKEKSTPEGLTMAYEYLPGTNLCTKTLCQYNGKVQERTFCTYDDNGEIQTLIEDDGSSAEENDLSDVTFRKIKHIQAVKEQGPSFGKPQKISAFMHQPQGEPLLLRETYLTYDEKGCEKERQVFDGKGQLHYVLTKQYDERLRLIAESDPLGHITSYAYDEMDNKIAEELIGSGKKTAYTYDLWNRLVKKIESHAHGEEFVTHYKYNLLGQLIKEKDPYGQITTYQYDRLGNQTECQKSPIQGLDDKPLFPTTYQAYNLLGHPISKTDENGYTTSYAYNLYGQPTHITYPDGYAEQFTYTPAGHLKQKWQADGTSIIYTRDPKGRLTKETLLDRKGHVIKAEHFCYKGPLLQSKTDAMGLVTTYLYDGAGRKIEEKIGDFKTIHYLYDDFDRLISIQQAERAEHLTYDAKDRLISKTWQSQGLLFAKETYSYDLLDKQVQKTIWQSSDQIALYQSHYHSDGTLAWSENPLQARTRYEYDHHKTSNLGGCVLARTLLDPLNRPTIETEDTWHRLAKREIFENGQPVACTDFSYDPIGHCIQEKATVFANGAPLRDYIVRRKYNARGLLKAETELPDGKTMRYFYDPMARLKQKEKPDGTKLFYAYNPLGKLHTLSSSDGTIAYTYTYDLAGRLIEVYDSVHNCTQKRSFDLLGRLEKEELSPGLTLHYTYDAFDRITNVILPDGSALALHL